MAYSYEQELDALKNAQKRYFQILYNMLLGLDQGPKLGLFLMALNIPLPDKFLVHGWIIMKDGKIVYHGDSDAILVKGIVALLIRVLSGHTPKEIVDAELYFIDEINLREHLSPTRSNGLSAMLKQMRLFALTFSQL